MVHADLLGSWLDRWSIFSDYNDDIEVRSIVVSYITSILVSVLTALVAFRLLRQLRFSMKESVAGVLGLMFFSTHLPYTPNMMGNNYLLLLTLSCFSFHFVLLLACSRRAAFLCSRAP